MTGTLTPPDLTGPAPGAVPRWVRWTAHTVPLLTLPSGFWRIAYGLGVPVGVTGRAAEEVPGLWITPYVILLSLVAEGLGLLTLGLVQPWGEVAPRWLPLVGGRRIPLAAAAVPAGLGAAVLIWLSARSIADLTSPVGDVEGLPDGGWLALMAACYAPLLLWGPLLAVVTVAYVRRRVQAQRLARTSPVS